MKLFVAVCLAFVLSCHASEPDCNNKKECEEKGPICGFMNGIVLAHCLNYEPCPFYELYCDGEIKFVHYGECPALNSCWEAVNYNPFAYRDYKLTKLAIKSPKEYAELKFEKFESAEVNLE